MLPISTTPHPSVLLYQSSYVLDHPNHIPGISTTIPMTSDNSPNQTYACTLKILPRKDLPIHFFRAILSVRWYTTPPLEYIHKHFLKSIWIFCANLANMSTSLTLAIRNQESGHLMTYRPPYHSRNSRVAFITILGITQSHTTSRCSLPWATMTPTPWCNT